MLMNNLDPEVAEDPDQPRRLRRHRARGALVGGLPRDRRDAAPARGRRDAARAVRQAGRRLPHARAGAARAASRTSLLVPDWADWETFRRLEAEGLTMYGQMTAGSWIYIGTQGILQGTYETFAAVAREQFDGTLRGRARADRGLRRHGRRAAAGRDDARRRLPRSSTSTRTASSGASQSRYLDLVAPDLDAALREAEEARAAGDGRSIGIVGYGRRGLPRAARARRPARHRHRPDERARSARRLRARRPLAGRRRRAARERPAALHRALARSMARHCAAMVEFQERGAEVFDYGNSLRAEARTGGFDQAFAYPGFVEAYVRPLFCRGTGPFRWAALSGDPRRHRGDRRRRRRALPRERAPAALARARARRASPIQGLPARICWLGYGERHRAGLRFNELVRSGEVSAPIVIGRDHLDSGSVASPYRETEGMMDGSDAIADWPILNALLGVSSGAAWVAVHHGGGVGIGRSIHSGVQVVADGTDEGALRLERVLTNDPGHGRDAARGRGLRAGARDGARARPRPADAAVSCALLVPDLVLEPGGARARGPGGRARGRHDRGGRRRGAARRARRRRAPARPAARPRPRQRPLARLPARTCAGASRCAPPAAPEDDFWSWREAMYAAAEALDPRADARRGGGVLRRGPARRLHDRRRVPLRPPPARRHALRGAERARAGGDRGGARGRRPHRAADGRLRARRARAAGRAPAQRRFCDRSVEAYLDRVERLAAERRGRSARDRRLRAALAARRAARLARSRSPSTRPAPATRCHIHAGEQPREIEESLEEFGLRPIEHLADCGVLGAGGDGRARHARLAERARPARRRPARPCAPARPPRPTSATASCPPTSSGGAACRSPSAPTPTCASTRSRRPARRRAARAA